MTLDTLTYARRLREAGFSEKQAEGLAGALAASLTDSLERSQGYREMQGRIDWRFASIDITPSSERSLARIDASFDRFERAIDALFDKHTLTRADLAGFERRMTMRLSGIMVASVVFFSALNKLL